VRPLRERLLIFDCDGVLVDSETLVIEIEAELLQAAGVSITAAEIATMCVGLSDGEIHRSIEDRWQVRLPRDFAEKKRARSQRPSRRASSPSRESLACFAMLKVHGA
jgi:phosphoglycolate phosphatase